MAGQVSSYPPGEDFRVATGDLLTRRSYSYQVQSFLGEGTFGKVAKCNQLGSNNTVAVKIMKDHPDVMHAAKQEVSILKKLRALDPDTCNLVQWNGYFIDRGYMCLEFELLDISLQDFMRQRHFQPLPLEELRPILHQLATALKHLRSIGIVHADLKPENVMLVDHRRQPHKVKIIDFGLACEASKTRLGSYIQTRWYRSPEIMLGLPFTEAIDMWSLGCVAAGLFLGFPLYPGTCEYSMMRYIVETQGQPPDHLLNSGGKTQYFFQRNTSSGNHHWRLKTPVEYWSETGTQSVETRRCRLNSLDDLKQIQPTDNVAGFADRCQFVDLLKQMMELDARIRITPDQVLDHPFISMSHLEDIFYHVRFCFKMMDFSERQSLDSDNGKTVTESSSTAHLAQQSIPHQVHPTGMSSRAQPLHQNTNSHASITQTQSRLKRKRVQVEAVESGYSNTKTRLPTSSSSQAASKSGQPNPVITAPHNRETVQTGTKRARVSPKRTETNKKRAKTKTKASRGTPRTKTTTSSQSSSLFPPASSGQARVPVRNGSTAASINGRQTTKTGSKRARDSPSAESNIKRAKTKIEASRGTSRTKTTAYSQSSSLFPPASSGQARVPVRSGSTAASNNGRQTSKTASKRARDSPSAESNKKRTRTETEAPGATAQANTTASTSQTGTLSPMALNPYATFLPQFCFYSAGLP